MIAAIAILAFIAGAQTGLQAGNCTVNLGTTHQTIDGFGGSCVWSGQITDAQADTIFGNANNNQLGFTLARVRIAPDGNNTDDTVNCSKAHARGAKVLATPWTPPASMKDNGNVVGGHLLTSQYAAYATYLHNSASSMGVDYCSIQNEPDITVTYESCTWSAAQLQTFCQNNAQNIGKPVVMPESYHFADSMSDPTLNNSTSASHIAYVGGHIYGGGNTVHQNALNHGKHVWMTEHYNTGTDIGTCMTDAKEITDCMNNSMSAYFWWSMFRPGSGNDIVSGSTPLKHGYTMGQFAKWAIRPGNVRVDSTYNPSSNVYVTAYKGSKVVIVAVNTGGSAVNQTFNIQNGTVTSMTPYRTSSSQNIATLSSINLSGGSFTTSLPAQSVTTFVQN
ncbi:MAG: glucuronoxylanase XynC [Verrucomicrobiota bacterium]